MGTEKQRKVSDDGEEEGGGWREPGGGTDRFRDGSRDPEMKWDPRIDEGFRSVT
jgi:hypothetical protein